MLIWVPTLELAAELEVALQELWPAHPVTVEVGEPPFEEIAWDGDRLVSRDGRVTDVEGPAEAALVVRSWLVDPERDIGWIPSIKPVSPPPPASVEEEPEATARAPFVPWVACGLAKRVDLHGVINQARFHGGVSRGALLLNLTLTVPVPNNRRPRRLANEAPEADGYHYFDVTGFGGALFAGVMPRFALGERSSLAVGPIGGWGIRQRARRRSAAPTGPSMPLPSVLESGPEAGGMVEWAQPGWGVRLSGVARASVLETFRVHGLFSMDVVIPLP